MKEPFLCSKNLNEIVRAFPLASMRKSKDEEVGLNRTTGSGISSPEYKGVSKRGQHDNL